MERAAGSPLPEKFPSSPGVAFPVFHTLSELAGFSRVAVVPAALAEELAVLALFDGMKLNRILVANLTDATRNFRIIAPGVTAQRMQVSPYALARICMNMEGKKDVCARET